VIIVCYKTTVILIRGIYLKTLFLSLLNVNLHTTEYLCSCFILTNNDTAITGHSTAFELVQCLQFLS